MNWLQFQFELSSADLSLAEQKLIQLGCLSISLMDAEDQPLLEPLPGEMPLWRKISVLALFPASVVPALIKLAFFDQMEAEIIAWRYKHLKDQEWVRAWMDDFHPMRFGNRLWICPSWTEPPDPDGVNLKLDPGLAFGSGTHATTALCLEWLDANPPVDQTVIDYGCGSGILSLAALKLGARKVIGVDIDPQALQASRENAQRNEIDDNCYPLLNASAPIIQPVDLLMANILAGPLIALASQISQLVKSTGSIILSGILDEQADNVVQAFLPWFNIKNQTSKQGWQLIEAQRSTEEAA